MVDSVAFFEKTLERLLEWIRAADAKIPPVAAISTSMLAVIAALFPDANNWDLISVGAGILAIIPLAICLILLFLASFPQTKGPTNSLIFFEGIKINDSTTYCTKVKKMTEEEYIIDLAEQCHRNAEIAGSKYWLLKCAMKSLFLSLLPWLFFVFVLYRNG
jgi:hypothetical protein